MSMPKARVTAQMPRPIDSHSGNDNDRAERQASRRAHHRKAFGEPQQHARQPVCEFAGKQVLEFVGPAARRRRIARGHEHREQHEQRQRSDRHASDFDQAVQPAVRPVHARIEQQHERGEQHNAGDRIEQPLDDDRRERRGRAQPLLPRQQVRTNHLAGTRGQHRARRKSDGRRSKRGRKPRVANRLEQVLPPKRAQHHRHDRDGRRQRNHPRIGTLDFRPHDIQMGAAKEKREQPNRQDDDEDGAKRFLHGISAKTAGLL